VKAAVFVVVSFFTHAQADKAEEFIGYLNRECKERNII